MQGIPSILGADRKICKQDDTQAGRDVDRKISRQEDMQAGGSAGRKTCNQAGGRRKEEGKERRVLMKTRTHHRLSGGKNGRFFTPQI